jgi:3,4-dihydroxy-2-butanone 4-phosphate synthase
LRDGNSIRNVRGAINALRAGQMVIVVDDLDREHEGDLVIAAEYATPSNVAFAVRHSSGVLVVAMTGERLDELELPMMVRQEDNTESQGTAFTVSVDLRRGTTSGISCPDRAATIRALGGATTQPDDFRRPGHVFPLRARPGGVLERRGHTEAGVDLMRAAGLTPAAMLCELMNNDGTMTRLPGLITFAHEHGLRLISIQQLTEYRLGTAIGAVRR